MLLMEQAEQDWVAGCSAAGGRNLQGSISGWWGTPQLYLHNIDVWWGDAAQKKIRRRFGAFMGIMV